MAYQMAQDLDALKIKYFENLAKRRMLEEEAGQLAWQIISDDIKKLLIEAFSEETAREWLINPHLLMQGSPFDDFLNNGPERIISELKIIISGNFA